MTPMQEYRPGVRADESSTEPKQPTIGEPFCDCLHLYALSTNGHLSGRYSVDWFRSQSGDLIALCQSCSAKTMLGEVVELSTEIKTLTGYKRCAPN
jgi:hypothetical protein